jgi:phosphocarrier protein HPr
MPERVITVPAGVGLHARPAAVFVQAAVALPADVTVAKPDGAPVSAKSILSVLGLDVRGGEQVVLRADGEGAEEALESLAGVIAASGDHG